MNRACCDRSAGPFSVIRGVFFLTCVLLAVFFVAGYASGWIKFHRNELKNTATIEINTGEMKAEANQAVEKGEQLLKQAGNKIRDLGKDATRDSVPTSIRVETKTESTPPTPSTNSAPASVPTADGVT